MIAAGATALTSLDAAASQPRLRVANAAPLPSRATVVPGAHLTNVDLMLTSRDASGEKTFLRELTTVGAPQYRHFLTPEQFAQRFGALPSNVRALRQYFAARGLSVGPLSRGRLVLPLRGSTTQMAHAFDASVVTVRVRGVQTSQFTSAATLPASLAHAVVGVAGLSGSAPRTSSLARPHVTAKYTGTCPSAGSATATVPGPLGGYNAGQEGALLGLTSDWSKGITGQGSVIALYELGTYDPTDLTTFFNCYRVAPTINKMAVDGGATGAYSDEATVDVEQAGALAPGATLDVYSGPNSGSGPIDVYTKIADDNLATIVSTSWGDCEADPTGSVATEQPLFEQMAAEGMTVVAAAGDYGSSDCHGVTNDAPVVDDPASQPFVTGVGGLTVSAIAPLNASVWNSGSSGGASGGGVSTLWTRPWWQSGTLFSADGSQGVSTATGRMVPDLSVPGDPTTGFVQYFTGGNGTGATCAQGSCANGWNSIGGTSIGAPMVSALFAIANQSCGTTRLGFMNPTLYEIAKTPGNYVDVTTGSNDIFGQGSYSAGVGYDLASGLGIPSSTFLNNLCPPAVSLTTSSLAPSTTGPIYVSHSVTLTTTVLDSLGFPIANAAVTYHATATRPVVLNNDPTTVLGSGVSSAVATTSARGQASVTLTSQAAQVVTVTASVNSGLIATTVLSFVVVPYAKRPPLRPTLTHPVVQSTSVALSIKAVAGPHPPVNVYEVTVNKGKTWILERGSVRRFRLKRLLPRHTYLIAVRAVNRNGSSSYSTPLRVTTLA